jgi:hypothetical protein
MGTREGRLNKQTAPAETSSNSMGIAFLMFQLLGAFILNRGTHTLNSSSARLANPAGLADGNKRTALVSLVVFVDRSDYELSPLDGEDFDLAIDQMILDVVTHLNGLPLSPPLGSPLLAPER